MNKYLIVSDIHLGDKHSRADLVLKVLKENKAKTIIIAGDLFDHHNLHRLNKRIGRYYLNYANFLKNAR